MRTSSIPNSQSGIPESRQESQASLPVTASLDNIQAPSVGKGLADALGVVAKVGTNVVADVEKDHSVQGQADAQSGNKDASLFSNSPAYMKSYLVETTKAKWVQYRDQVNASLDGFLANNPNALPEDVNKYLESHYRQFLFNPDGTLANGVSDPDVAKEILPLMQQNRAEALDSAFKTVKQGTQNNFLASVALNTEDQLKHTGGIDYNSMHDTIIKSGLATGQETNQAMFQMVSALAEKYGRPDLVQNIPDKWDNGVPSFKSIPAFAPHIVDALNAASLSQQRMQKSLYEANDRTLTTIALAGGDVRGATAQMLSQGSIDPETARTVFTFNTGAIDTLAKAKADNTAMANLELNIYHGTASYRDVMMSYMGGTLGTPGSAPARTEFSRLVGLVDNAKSDVFKDPTFITYMDAVESLYAPPKGPLGQVLNQADVLKSSTAERRFREMVLKGTAPADAYENVKKQVPVPLRGAVSADNAFIKTSLDQMGATADNDRFSSVLNSEYAGHLKSSLQDLGNKRMTPLQFAAYYSELRADPNRIVQLKAQGFISDTDAKAALDAIQQSFQP